jgi:hypothetical protein
MIVGMSANIRSHLSLGPPLPKVRNVDKPFGEHRGVCFNITAPVSADPFEYQLPENRIGTVSLLAKRRCRE